MPGGSSRQVPANGDPERGPDVKRALQDLDVQNVHGSPMPDMYETEHRQTVPDSDGGLSDAAPERGSF